MSVKENKSLKNFKNLVFCPFCSRPLYRIKPSKVYLCKCPTIYYKLSFDPTFCPNDLSYEVMDLCNILLDECYRQGYNDFENMFGAVCTYPRMTFSKYSEISPKLFRSKKNLEFIIFIKIFRITSRKKNPIIPNYFLTIPEEVISEYPKEEAGRWVN